MWRPLSAVLLLILLAAPAPMRPAYGAPYSLGAGDQVRLKVYEWRSAVGDVHEWTAFSADFGIGADGSLSLPLLGTVPAAGHTLDQLAGAVGARLQTAVGLATPPQVSVEVVKYRPFYILGSVNKPGEYPFRPGVTVLQAVSIAGGLFRVNDPGLLLAQRGMMTAAGDLRVLQLDLNVAMARRARLKAEVDGSAKIAFPRELLQQQGDQAVAQLMEQEQVMFTARRDALRSETDALNRLKDLLNGEVASLKSKTKTVDQQLALLKTELESLSSLVQRGLAAAPREFSLRQTELQTQGQRLDLDTSMLRAREDIGKADQAMIELANKTRNATLAELAQVEGKLSETAARIRTNKAILEQESAGPDLAAIFSEQSGPPTYSIIRRNGEEAQKLAVTEAGVVQPGDTIEVRRAGADASLSAVSAGSSATAAERAETKPEPKLTPPPRRQGPQAPSR
jgi:exopolysaccharide production protein ExoF